MGFVVCVLYINLVMESVTRKGREVSLEPSQFHGLFSFKEGLENGRENYCKD